MATVCQTSGVCDLNPTGLVVVDNADQLRNASVANGCAEEAIMLGLVTAYDGAGGFYYRDANDVQADDGISVLSSIHGGSWLKHI